MSLFTVTPPTASDRHLIAPNVGSPAEDDVVEISLLLPAAWTQNLLEMSRQRGQSVGQILRSMIGQALHDGVSKP